MSSHVGTLAQEVEEWNPPSLETFQTDLEWLYEEVCCGKTDNSFSYKRLKQLEKTFDMHTHLNSSCVAAAGQEGLLTSSKWRATSCAVSNIVRLKHRTHISLQI